MISRGYFIGEIVDSFSDISNQVITRGKLGLTDLNIYLEDFYKVALNHLYGLSLNNLNQERSNSPGIDLGDEAKGMAFQITSVNTSQKVNKTLKAITTDQINNYPQIKILIIGRKQKKYSLDKDECKRVGFNEEDIWDLDDLCKKCLDLPTDVLQLLYNHVKAELMRVKIELEIPDQDGHYPTNIENYTENIPKPRIGDCTKFYNYLEDNNMAEAPIEDSIEDLNILSAVLSRLPRITRSFLAIIIERREKSGRMGYDYMEINADKLTRIISYPDTEGELRLLKAYDLITIIEPDEPSDSHSWKISCSETSDYFFDTMVEFAESNNIPLSRPVVNLDFSDF